MSNKSDKRGYVLIIEDEEENVEILVRTLRADATLWIARTIDEARQTLANNEVNVVVTDHRLPDGTGVSLLEEVAQKRPAVGRVLVTAYGDSQEVIEACNRGTVERFFLKPYAPQHLRAAVLELLRRHGVVARPRVLVAEDDKLIRQMVRDVLTERLIDMDEAADGEAAVAVFDQHPFDVALVDITMPKLDGVGVLKQILSRDPDLPVIMVTASDMAVGLNLLEAGAFDIVSKPIRQDELLMRVERAVLARRQTEEHKRLLKEMQASRQQDSLVAESEEMKKVVEQARMVAKHDVNVLVRGETGTGKEVIARLLHLESRRSQGPFIPVNCGAIPENLIESELFGHERGAFTDAKATKAGFFESADGGSIFLDEIAELSLQAQVRLLRVLETKEVQRVGSTKQLRVDVRVIAATHQDVETRVKDGSFRQDLFYRLNGFAITIPPLRLRAADIGALIEMAATNFCMRNGMPMPEITTSALQQARRYQWPGNVRELLNVVERTLITRGPTRIDELEIVDARRGKPEALGQIDDSLPIKEALDPIMAEMEKQYLIRVLERCHGHLGHAAQHAGIHRKSLYNKLKRYGISVDELLERTTN